MDKFTKYLSALRRYYSGVDAPYAQEQPIIKLLSDQGASVSIPDLLPLPESTRLIIVGPPGSGKTMVLHSLARACLDIPIIPILVPLRSYSSNLKDLITVQIQRFDESIAFGDFLELFASSQGVLLLDGFDEVAPSQLDRSANDVEEIIDRSPTGRSVLTSRYPVDQYFARWTVYRVMPLSDQDVASFVTTHVGSTRYQQLLANQDLHEIARHPVFLETVTELLRQGDVSQDSILYGIASELVRQEYHAELMPSEISVEQIDAALTHLALESTLRHNRSLTRSEAIASLKSHGAANFPLEQVNVEDLLRAVERSALIRVHDDQIGFLHLRIQEIYAARALHQMAPKQQIEIIKQMEQSS